METLDNVEKNIEEQVSTKPEKIEQLDAKSDHSSDVLYSTYDKSSQDVIKSERNPSIYETSKNTGVSQSIKQSSPYVFQRNKNNFQQNTSSEEDQSESNTEE